VSARPCAPALVATRIEAAIQRAKLGTRGGVGSVQHYPPQLKLDSVAEIHVVAADDFDKWGGEFPGAAAVLGR
jgi:hypothetical protein